MSVMDPTEKQSNASLSELDHDLIRDSEVLFIMNREMMTYYQVHTSCFMSRSDRSDFSVRNAFTNCGRVRCHFCGRWDPPNGA